MIADNKRPPNKDGRPFVVKTDVIQKTGWAEDICEKGISCEDDRITYERILEANPDMNITRIPEVLQVHF